MFGLMSKTCEFVPEWDEKASYCGESILLACFKDYVLLRLDLSGGFARYALLFLSGFLSDVHVFLESDSSESWIPSVKLYSTSNRPSFLIAGVRMMFPKPESSLRILLLPSSMLCLAKFVFCGMSNALYSAYFVPEVCWLTESASGSGTRPSLLRLVTRIARKLCLSLWCFVSLLRC